MDEKEVIKRLNEHLKAKQQENGYIREIDKNYSIHYVMDFLRLSRDDAKQFLKDNVPMAATI